MSRTRIDISGELANFSVRAEMDGTIYSLRFSWNERAAAWTVDLGDDAESEWYVRGWRLEPVVETDALLDVMESVEDITTDRFWSMAVFGRFFYPAYLWATSTEPLTTQEGLSSVELIYSDVAEALAIADENAEDNE